MTGTHVTVGTVFGATLAATLAKYGIKVDKVEAAVAGAALAGVLTGLAHIVATQGLWPAVKRIFVGPKPPVA